MTERLRCDNGGAPRLQPTTTVDKRRCPKCDKRRDTTVTRDGDGRARMRCSGCGWTWEGG